MNPQPNTYQGFFNIVQMPATKQQLDACIDQKLIFLAMLHYNVSNPLSVMPAICFNNFQDEGIKIECGGKRVVYPRKGRNIIKFIDLDAYRSMDYSMEFDSRWIWQNKDQYDAFGRESIKDLFFPLPENLAEMFATGDIKKSWQTVGYMSNTLKAKLKLGYTEHHLQNTDFLDHYAMVAKYLRKVNDQTLKYEKDPEDVNWGKVFDHLIV